MNQDQAKFIDEHWDMFSNLINAGHVDVNHTHSPEMRRHIKKFAEVGKYQGTAACGGWYTDTYFNFNSGLDFYRPVPERKINWEKAMENGAWGHLFLFWNKDGDTPVQAILHGYNPCGGIETRFSAHGEGYHYTMPFRHCKPDSCFIVPGSWYEDQ